MIWAARPRPRLRDTVEVIDYMMIHHVSNKDIQPQVEVHGRKHDAPVTPSKRGPPAGTRPAHPSAMPRDYQESEPRGSTRSFDFTGNMDTAAWPPRRTARWRHRRDSVPHTRRKVQQSKGKVTSSASEKIMIFSDDTLFYNPLCALAPSSLLKQVIGKES